MCDQSLAVNPVEFFIKLTNIGWVNLESAAKSKFFFPYLKAQDGYVTVKMVTVSDSVQSSDHKVYVELPDSLTVEAVQLLAEVFCSSVIHGYTCIKVYPQPESDFHAELTVLASYKSGAEITLGVIRRNKHSKVEFHS